MQCCCVTKQTHQPLFFFFRSDTFPSPPFRKSWQRENNRSLERACSLLFDTCVWCSADVRQAERLVICSQTHRLRVKCASIYNVWGDLAVNVSETCWAAGRIVHHWLSHVKWLHSLSLSRVYWRSVWPGRLACVVPVHSLSGHPGETGQNVVLLELN